MKNDTGLSGEFVSTRVYTAVCQRNGKEELILIESRQSELEKTLVFTVVDGKQIRIGSMLELVQSLPLLESLSMRHIIRVLWNNEFRDAELVETLVPSRVADDTSLPSLKLALVLEGKTYETTLCDVLTDAYIEMHEMTEDVAAWRWCTCFCCRYARHARFYSNSDRQYWCYRDVPDALAEIEAKGKSASSESRFAGNYYVDAFHTCAAWQPRGQ